MFIYEKGKVMVELNDEKCLWDLALLHIISYHLNGQIPNFKVNRNSFLICMGLSKLFK